MMEVLKIRAICTHLKPLVTAFGLALLLAACGSSTGTVDATLVDETPEPASLEEITSETTQAQEAVIDDGGEPLALDVGALTSGTWTLMFGGGPEGDVVLVDGYPVTMTFGGDGSFGGTAACNGYGGGYEIDGNQISLGRIGWEEMGCAPDVQGAESAFLAALFDVTDINLIGSELALGGVSTGLIFSQSQGLLIEELWGRSFVLAAMLPEGVPSPVQGEEPILAIHPNNSLTAGTGCRTLEGNFTVFGSEIILTESTATGECSQALTDQDSHIISVLGDGFTVEFDGGQLLISSAGNQGLQYRDTTSDAVVDAPGDDS